MYYADRRSEKGSPEHFFRLELSKISRQRNHLLSLTTQHYPASLERYERPDWEEDWRNVLVINLPEGKEAWFINDKDLYWFDHLPRGVFGWQKQEEEAMWISGRFVKLWRGLTVGMHKEYLARFVKKRKEKNLVFRDRAMEGWLIEKFQTSRWK